MTAERTRTGLVLVVALLTVGMGVVAPVAATPTDSSTGSTIGDTLHGDSDGTDDGQETDDSDTTDGSDTTDESTSDDGDSTNESDASGAETDDSTPDDSTDDSATDDDSDANDSTDGDRLSEEEGDEVSAGNVTDRVNETVEDSVEAADGPISEVTEAAEELTDSGASYISIETARIRDLGEAEPTDTTDDAVDSVTGNSDTVLVESGLLSVVDVIDEDRTTAPARPGSSNGSGSSEDAAPALLDFDGRDGADSDGGTPPGPTAGLAIGIGAVTVGTATRQGALIPRLAANLGAALTAGAIPVSAPGTLDRLFRTLAPFRYSRYDDSDPLEHQARADVFALIEESPGAYLSELAESADVPLSTARHHVRVLEREDVVSGAKVRGKRRFYPAHATDVELSAAMNDESTAAVLDALARLGAASVSAIADEVGRDPSTVTHHLQRLEEDDIVVRERDGRAVVNKLSPEARRAFEPDSPEAEAAERGEALASD